MSSSTTSSGSRYLIAAGGTAGHVVPALAVADELRTDGSQVVFAGGERAEAQLVPAAGYELVSFRVQGLSRTNPLKALASLGRAVVAAESGLGARDARAPSSCHKRADAHIRRKVTGTRSVHHG